MLLALTGRNLSANEAREWGLVLKVMDGKEKLIREAVRLEEEIVGESG